MSYNCTLSNWQTNSRIIHTISQFPDGPYSMVNITINIFSHNPTIHKIPKTNNYFMYYIGSANTKNNSKINCAGNTSFHASINKFSNNLNIQTKHIQNH